MIKVLSLVNSVSSTSIPVEIAHAVNEATDTQVTLGAMMQNMKENLDPDIKEMDIPIAYFDGKSNFDPNMYLRLHQHISANDYDIVHTHSNFSGSISRVVSWFDDVCVINTEHNDYRHYTYPQKVSNSFTYMIPEINIYNSESTMLSLDGITTRLSSQDRVIYNGVNLSRIGDSKNQELPINLPNKNIISNVGVMTRQKNQQAILETAERVSQSDTDTDYHFVIAGSGPLYDDLQRRSKKLGVDDIVTFTGYLPKREHVYRLLHESDIFMMPSLYEGFCVAAVEAMACGLPIIASELNVLREVIGDSGFFADPSDISEFSSHLTTILSQIDQDSIESVKSGLRRRAVENFSLNKTAQKYHDTYVEVS